MASTTGSGVVSTTGSGTDSTTGTGVASTTGSGAGVASVDSALALSSVCITAGSGAEGDSAGAGGASTGVSGAASAGLGASACKEYDPSVLLAPKGDQIFGSTNKNDVEEKAKLCTESRG